MRLGNFCLLNLQEALPVWEDKAAGFEAYFVGVPLFEMLFIFTMWILPAPAIPRKPSVSLVGQLMWGLSMEPSGSGK